MEAIHERSLIVKKEWLDLILAGKKPWEMRSTKTKIRGWINLIESGSGLIIGESHLSDCLPAINTHKDLIKFHKQKNGLCTMVLTTVDEPSAYGVVILNEEKRIFLLR